MPDIAKLRENINNIDLDILNLLEKRAKNALEIGKIKQNTNNNYYHPDREANNIKKITEKPSILKTEHISNIFSSIMQSCLDLQQPQKIAYLGPKGSFSQLALIKQFGNNVNNIATENIQQIFEEVQAGNANYGIIPIENSTAGVVNISLDILLKYHLKICGEILLPINHCLLVNQNNAKIEKIFAHEQALYQCNNWLTENFPKANKISVSSNSKAAVDIVNKNDSAAIGSNILANEYNLKIYRNNIADNPRNTTRFLIIANQETKTTGNDKTSVIIYTPHSPGSLAKLLQPFCENNVNISLIESKPHIHHSWHYMFFIDFTGHQQDNNVQNLINDLKEMDIEFEILGSYPKG